MNIRRVEEVPECLRYHNARTMLKDIFEKQTDARAHSKMPEVEAACKKVIRCNVDPSLFSNTRSNPGPDIVEDLYESVGIPKIFDIVTCKYHQVTNIAVHNTWAKDRLQEIMSRRHNAAHSFSMLKVSITDFDTSLSYLKETSPIFESELDDHIINIIQKAT